VDETKLHRQPAGEPPDATRRNKPHAAV
jgi:hypothetical protein